MPQQNNQAVISAVLRQDLGAFVCKVFQTVSPGDTYVHNWHIDAVVHVLNQIYQGNLRRLIVNQPPRSLKSICVSIAYVAWALGHDPTLRFACVSYSQELATTFARQFRTVITSDWYRALFSGFQLAKDSENECVTTLGGGRFALSVGGSFTGRGADIIIIDDPMKADDALSDKARRALNDWFSTTLLSRLDDKGKGVIVLVMQRLHEDDLSGKLLGNGGWYQLNLPAIAEGDQQIPVGPQAIHVFKKGEPLQAAREPLDLLNVIKREMGSLTFSAQYLQSPVPVDGNLVKRAWINWYSSEPDRAGGMIVQSWDVASTTGHASDWSACTTWLKLKRRYYLLDVWRGRLEFPELKRQLVRLAHRFGPNTILIEHAGPGLHLIQEFKANPINSVPIPIGIKPQGEKLVRMEAQCARFEAGQIFLPHEAPWLSAFLHEIFAFPNARHDDQVDSVSQFLKWAEADRGLFAMIGEAPKIFIGGQQWQPPVSDD